MHSLFLVHFVCFLHLIAAYFTHFPPFIFAYLFVCSYSFNLPHTGLATNQFCLSTTRSISAVRKPLWSICTPVLTRCLVPSLIFIFCNSLQQQTYKQNKCVMKLSFSCLINIHKLTTKSSDFKVMLIFCL